MTRAKTQVLCQQEEPKQSRACPNVTPLSPHQPGTRAPSPVCFPSAAVVRPGALSPLTLGLDIFLYSIPLVIWIILSSTSRTSST